MMEWPLALRVYSGAAPSQCSAVLERMDPEQLTAGEVLVGTAYSSVNYKDALAVVDPASVLRGSPRIPGIDVCGSVLSADVPGVQQGDAVFASGNGLGESRDGGFSEMVRLQGREVIVLPKGVEPRQAMMLGTAGLSAMLALERIEWAGATPATGPVAITGATGAVGAVAVALLAARGYEVEAVTTKRDAGSFLGRLGAAAVVHQEELMADRRPMQRARWAAAIDNVGGDLLPQVTGSLRHGGAVAVVGLAGGHAFPGSVLPLMLRGLSILGICSDDIRPERKAGMLAELLRLIPKERLDVIAPLEVSLRDVDRTFCQQRLTGKHFGRVLVRTAVSRA